MEDIKPQSFRNRLDLSKMNEKLNATIQELDKFVIGQSELKELMLICLISNGHILLEGVPGVAKTLSAKVLAKTLSAQFSRIQFTPDLMPADILGTSIFNLKTAVFDYIF